MCIRKTTYLSTEGRVLVEAWLNFAEIPGHKWSRLVWGKGSAAEEGCGAWEFFWNTLGSSAHAAVQHLTHHNPDLDQKAIHLRAFRWNASFLKSD